MRFPRHDLHTLTGVYALDAVDGTERDLFEHHLRRCKPCANEVRGLAKTATELAMAAAMPPPPAKIIGAPLSASQTVTAPENIVLSGGLQTKDHRSRAPPLAA